MHLTRDEQLISGGVKLPDESCFPNGVRMTLFFGWTKSVHSKNAATMHPRGNTPSTEEGEWH